MKPVHVLVHRYKKLCDGDVKKDKALKSWDDMVTLKNSMHRVQPADALHCSVTCKANPHHLVCRGCKPFASLGYCKHVAAVTHIMEERKDPEERDTLLDLRARLAPLNRPKRGSEVGAEEGSGIRPRGQRPSRWKRSLKQQSRLNTPPNTSGVRGGGVGKAARGTAAGAGQGKVKGGRGRRSSGARSSGARRKLVLSPAEAVVEAARRRTACWSARASREGLTPHGWDVAEGTPDDANSDQPVEATHPHLPVSKEVWHQHVGRLLARNQMDATEHQQRTTPDLPSLYDQQGQLQWPRGHFDCSAMQINMENWS